MDANFRQNRCDIKNLQHEIRFQRRSLAIRHIFQLPWVTVNPTGRPFDDGGNRVKLQLLLTFPKETLPVKQG